MKLHKSYRKYLYERDTVFATLSVFFLIGLLAFFPLNTGILNPIKKAFSDFDFNDLTYAKLGKNADTKLDSRIVVVNIGVADRAMIAGLIEKIALSKPKAIGLDAYFDGEREPESDSLLRKVMAATPQLIMASRINWEDNEHKLIENRGFFARPGNVFGYVNLIGEERGTIRLYTPIERYQGKQYLSLSSALLNLYDSTSYNKLSSRKKDSETINYSRGPNLYPIVDGNDLLAGNIEDSLFTNKIVLMGYLNLSPDDVQDKHYTPLNDNRKTLPDLNGIYIHANILSMALDQKYINTTPNWLNWIITILIAWLHISLFIRYYIDAHLWFHLVAKTAQIISAIFFVWISVMCFSRFNLKIDMKMPVTVIILAIDIIYFYEAFAVWMHEKFGFKTIFHHKH